MTALLLPRARAFNTRLRVFAVEDTSLQLTWGQLGPGTMHVRVGDIEKEVETSGGGGTLSIEGLEPGQDHVVVCRGDSLPRDGVRLTARTLDPPPGRELCRFATLSDLHVGITFFDVRKTMTEDLGPDEALHPERCARAATRELLAWGARHLVLKGDLVNRGRPDEWDLLGSIFADLPVDHDAIPGNHDARVRDPESLPWEEGARRAGIRMHSPIGVTDLPGLRVVLVDTTVAGHSKGRLPDDRVEATVEALRASSEPAVVILHHYLQRAPITWFWPPGVPRAQGDRFLRVLAEAKPQTLVSSGHTHRHRKRHVGPVVATEVGSPKDFPGTWGGYVVHEGGIRQVARRVEAPECIDWLERTGDAAFGAWGLWSPGPLTSRCFSHPWPT